MNISGIILILKNFVMLLFVLFKELNFKNFMENQHDFHHFNGLTRWYLIFIIILGEEQINFNYYRVSSVIIRLIKNGINLVGTSK